MCKLVNINTNFGTVCKVADIKKDYISNILTVASGCSDIEQIVLFGSSLEERCKDVSDIDIAIFGNKSETRFIKSKQFEKFERALYRFGEFQDYDILYFQNGNIMEEKIMEEVRAGAVIYKKGVMAVC